MKIKSGTTFIFESRHVSLVWTRFSKRNGYRPTFFLTLLNKACTVIATYDVIFVLSFIIIRQNVKFIYTYTFVMSNV